tara:strand:- start:16964 stop:18232 length:1269 start_codon:yes stop_codon:yes gene_type:complete
MTPDKLHELLIQAVKDNDLEAVNLLIEKGADVTAQENAAVIWAAENGHLEVVNRLIKAGADVTARENLAIIGAARNGHLELFNRLIEAGANVTGRDNLAIIGAAENGHLEVVNRLIEAGADVTARENLAIIWAAEYGHLEVSNRLIKAGADVTARENEAIIWAARYGHLAMINRLIEAGADVTARGNLAIIVAAGNGHLAVVNRLIEAGADVNAQDALGNSAIIGAAGNGYLAVVNRLIEAGADVTARNNYAMTLATIGNQLQVVERLAINIDVIRQGLPEMTNKFLASGSTTEKLHEIAVANTAFRNYLKHNYPAQFERVLDLRATQRELTSVLYSRLGHDLARIIMSKAYGPSANGCVESAIQGTRRAVLFARNPQGRRTRASQSSAQSDNRRPRDESAQDGMASPSPQKRQRSAGGSRP